MASSRDPGLEQFLADLPYPQVWIRAEMYLADHLGLDLEDGEHLGRDWVLTPDPEMLSRVGSVVDSAPGTVVLEVLVGALRGSYHLQGVHGVLGRIAGDAAERWREGPRKPSLRMLLSRTSQAYKYGVRLRDLDLVIEMCTEPTLAPQDEDDGEDLRAYWFASLAKLKDPRAYALCRDILAQDLGQWNDYRLVDAIRIVAKDWTDADAVTIRQVAAGHPDSWVRRQAVRVLERRA